MARHQWMRERMENWARWKTLQEAGAGRYAAVKLTDPTPQATDPYSDAPVRPWEEDAWEIDAALKAVVLSSELRATLECHYLSPRIGEAEKLRRLCIAKRTMYDRLDTIDGLVVVYLTDKRQLAVQERQRVEALQVSAAKASQGVLPTAPSRYITGKLGFGVGKADQDA